jgi:hypothetical protein
MDEDHVDGHQRLVYLFGREFPRMGHHWTYHRQYGQGIWHPCKPKHPGYMNYASISLTDPVNHRSPHIPLYQHDHAYSRHMIGFGQAP